MPAASAKQPDQARIVASLARECHMPAAELAALYEHERAELAAGARVTKFLHIFVTRRVLDILRERGLTGPASKGFASPSGAD